MLKTFGDFEFDDERRLLKAGGRPVRLTGQPLDLLFLLLERPGEVMSREEIYRRLWPSTNVELEHSLDVVVSRLRALLGDSNATPRFIQTVPRRGYRFIEPVIVKRQVRFLSRGSWPRRAVTVAAAAIVAAVLAILFVRTRYEKFVPSHQSQSRPADRTR